MAVRKILKKTFVGLKRKCPETRYKIFFIRTSNALARLDFLILVLNFRRNVFLRFLKISRFKFLEPINKDYLISWTLVKSTRHLDDDPLLY